MRCQVLAVGTSLLNTLFSKRKYAFFCQVTKASTRGCVWCQIPVLIIKTIKGYNPTAQGQESNPSPCGQLKINDICWKWIQDLAWDSWAKLMFTKILEGGVYFGVSNKIIWSFVCSTKIEYLTRILTNFAMNIWFSNILKSCLTWLTGDLIRSYSYPQEMEFGKSSMYEKHKANTKNS